jgi:hypothetical protein
MIKFRTSYHANIATKALNKNMDTYATKQKMIRLFVGHVEIMIYVNHFISILSHAFDAVLTDAT